MRNTILARVYVTMNQIRWNIYKINNEKLIINYKRKLLSVTRYMYLELSDNTLTTHFSNDVSDNATASVQRDLITTGTRQWK
jgi:hypothetical protein